MYKNLIVLAVKHNGKILRENKDLVLLPFGAEYSILIKNLNSKRMQVSVSIDGTDISDNETFIVAANSDIELKRFVRNGNMNEGNSFKFIERTGDIEEYRGIKIDDSIIRIAAQFEKIQKPVPIHYYKDYKYGVIQCDIYGAGTLPTGVLSTSPNSPKNGESRAVPGMYSTGILRSNDIGITVPGSKIEQQFEKVNNFIAEHESHILILKLAGVTTVDNIAVEEVTPVKNKVKCVTCGKSCKAADTFCSKCGTALHII